MSYFRSRFTSFEEFQRETGRDWERDLGKEEYELLREIEDEDRFFERSRRRGLDWE